MFRVRNIFKKFRKSTARSRTPRRQHYEKSNFAQANPALSQQLKFSDDPKGANPARSQTQRRLTLCGVELCAVLPCRPLIALKENIFFTKYM